MLRRTTALCACLLVLSVALHAQTDATLSGVVRDESQSVLPGVTVTATDVRSGRQYVSVSDERGEYRLPSILPGTYRVQGELQGFGTAVIPSVELLVGQNAALDLTLTVANLQETLTVTSETPLVNTQSIEVGGNIDRRQMEALPIQGRNWLELSLLVKGITQNDVGSNRPVGREDQLQLNLDGQQITQQVAGSTSYGQPRMSREAIAEYQVLTNMYDVTMGRSVGVQIQAVSRAGTNELHGTAYGYFRDDTLNAKDFVANRVLPYSNQQAGFSLGGPILKDRLQYFGTYEYEREPQTLLARPPALPNQSLALPTTIRQQSLLARVDAQMSPRDHLIVRGTYSNYENPFSQVTGTDYPTSATDDSRYSGIITANWSRVLSNNAVQEVRVGYYRYYWDFQLAEGVPRVANYAFPGFSVVSKFFYPQNFSQNMPSVRYDLNLHRGAHNLKIGGEYFHRTDRGDWPVNTRGTYTFSSLPADIARRFPIDAWNDPSRWDLSGLDPLVLRYTQSYPRSSAIDIPRKTWAVWLGDTWTLDRLTLNLGVRWDADWGALSPPGPGGTEFEDRTVLLTNGSDPDNYDVGYKATLRDLTNVAPRLGASYKVNERLVIRGGVGMFFSTQVSNLAFSEQLNNGQNVIRVVYNNDGKPGFIQDPTRGLTAEDVLSGQVALPPQEISTISPDYANPRTVQATVGFQQQIGETLGVDADLVYAKGTHLGLQRDINLTYDPTTGYPRSPRPRPDYGPITWYQSTLSSENLALATSMTRRFRDKWQAGLTYTLTFRNRDQGTSAQGYTGTVNNPFCIDCEWGPALGYQRHTLRLNGVYQAPWGISVAGIFNFGSGNRFVTSYPGNPFGIATGASALNRINTGAPFTIPETVTFNGRTIDVRDRFDGPATIASGTPIPRNALRCLPLAKLDLRLTKDVKVPGTPVTVSGMFEVFNVLNHANYGDYNGVGGSPSFGQPVQSANLAYQPRVVQLAFRVAF